MLPLLDLERQYLSIQDEIDAALLRAVASARYILGEEVALFEEEFAEYCETAAASALPPARGRSGLRSRLSESRGRRGDRSRQHLHRQRPSGPRLGARPVLVDCDEYDIDPRCRQGCGRDRPATRAIMAVHLYGQPADVDPLLELCARHDLALVEDAVRRTAPATRDVGRRPRAGGRFSFYPSRTTVLTATGAVTTDDEEVAERVRLLRGLGRSASTRT